MRSTSPTATDPLAHAKELCRSHGLFIVEKRDRIYDRRELVHREVTVWIVYRELAGRGRTRLGKRRDPAALLRFVRSLVRVPDEKAGT